jgi:hypothetical protein
VRTVLQPLLTRKDPGRSRELLRLAERNDRLRPCDYWPHAALIGVWTGGSCAAYLPTLREWFGHVPIRDHGLSASEGRMSIPFDDNTSTGLLDVTSHFFEFIPAEQGDDPHAETLLAHQLQTGADYDVILTTASGLCRYNISDVVCCRGYVGTTPLLEFLHKGAHIANLTGEKLTESQVVAAVAAASEQTGCRLSHYTLCPAWGDPPGYRLLVEESDLQPHHVHREAPPSAAGVSPIEAAGGRVSSAANGPAASGSLSSAADRSALTPRTLAAAVDAHLQQFNSEYRGKRATGRLSEVTLHRLPPGTWQTFITHQQTRPGSTPEQYKHPCLKPDLAFIEQITTLAERPGVMVHHG